MDEKVVLPLVRTHASILAGSAPNAAMTAMALMGWHPVGPKVTLSP